MYMAVRQINVIPAKMQDAIGIVDYLVGQMSEKYGADMSYSVMVGGDPNVIAVSSGWETLGQFEQMRTSYMADPELAAAMRMAAEMSTGASDMIAQIVKAPGEPGAYAQVNSAMMVMSQVQEAIGFAHEVAEFVEAKVGTPSGVLAGFTGNRSLVSWVGYASDLDEIGKNSQALETDADYLEFFSKSEGLFIPSSLEQSIWQILGGD